MPDDPPSAARIDRVADELEGLLKALRAEAAQIRAKAGPVETLTIAEASERFNVPKSTLRYWAKNRPGLGIRRAGRWRISLPELRRIVPE